MTDRTGWEDILDPGETVLWQGRPDTRLSMTLQDLGYLAFGLIFAGIALRRLLNSFQVADSPDQFLLLHLAAGLGLALWAVLRSPLKRHYSWYTLTDRRAFIGIRIPVWGRKLKSYPIGSDTVLDFDGGSPATILFAEEMRRTKRGTRQIPIGFERIAEGSKVYRLMPDIQERKTQ